MAICANITCAREFVLTKGKKKYCTQKCAQLTTSRNQIQNITGKTYNQLTAVKRDESQKGRGFWFFQCICGRIKSINITKVKTGHTKSCGCLAGRYENGRSSVFNEIYGFYKRNAKKRKLVFDLTFDQFESLIYDNCFYCGCDPANCYSNRTDTLFYNGIDRIDSSKGYFTNNVRSCCKTCNQAKSNLSEVDFYNWLKRISAYLSNKNLL